MTSTLQQWALDWGVLQVAIQDLAQRLSNETKTDVEQAGGHAGLSEAGVASRIRLAEAQAGNRIWRNNLGAVTTDDGRHLRYGLCNESAKMNKAIKSADYIGIHRRLIRPEDVGSHLGQFLAIETKRSGWRYSGDEHEVAQLAFLTLVNSLGGVGKFSTGEEYEKQ